MQAVIMVGGMGVRLRPFTYTIPKPLLPIGDITILESIVQSLCESGCKQIFLLTSYQHQKFEQCYDYEEKYGIEVNIIREKEKMGTIGGISLLKGQLDENFLVLNGDLIVKVDFKSMFNYHLENSADITLGVTQYNDTIPYGVVKVNENKELIEIIEKPKQSFLISSGIYVLSSSLFDYDDERYMDMPTLISEAQFKGKRIITYNIGNKWLDTGQFENYEAALDKIEEWSRS